ncbi:MAG TPA: autotransporter-associated beta strand repeat-containing protein [Candidatus Acidoferrum sp.]|nr:autotransporter-associated beta strand repeat-containing protein [Candidatus Acidoferrum sp.]
MQPVSLPRPRTSILCPASFFPQASAFLRPSVFGLRISALCGLLAGTLTLSASPSFQQVGSTLIMSNVNVQVQYNLTTGRADFYWQNAKKIAGFYAGVGLANYITGTGYSSHTWSVLSSNQVVVTSTNTGLPVMKQYFTLDQDNSFLTRVTIESAGTNSNWMGPVVMDTTGGVDIGSYNDNRALFVPFDNDHFIRYNAMRMNSTSNSYEVAAFYDNTTRNGLVVGSVTHDTWKTGIYFVGANNKLNAMNVYGGATSSTVTWDVLPHGAISGTNISSPTVFVGFSADWRAVLESYADENALMAPKLAWNNGVPFGWNSWYAFQTTISYSAAITVSDFIHGNLQPNNFSNNNVYVNLDSYWSNLSSSQLVSFASHCHANGQKAGIYWGPWVWWGSPANISNTVVEGSTYYYSDIALRTPGGILQTNDGAIALDPTHPGTLQRVNYYIGQFLSQGYDYLKLDFLSHGAMEGVHYAPGVTTGIQAYNQGMFYLMNQINGRMYISESIAPIFPYQYAHSRRIACDTANTIANTEYEMQSVSYGWWLSGRLYQFNDPDLMEFAGVTANENQSRLISGAVSGTLFLNSDDLTSSTGQTLALTCLTNAAVNAVARLGQTFRPVEGNSGTSAADTLVLQNGADWYVAVFNYSGSATNKTVNFSRAGIPSSTCGALDLWSGQLSSVSGSLSVSLGAKQSRLFKLVSVPQALLSASPSLQSTTNGGNTTFTINLSVSGCFTDTLVLSVSGLPSGATAVFTPASLSAAGSASLSVTAPQSTRSGTYPLTITGGGATLTNSTTATLVITRTTAANLRWNSSSSSTWDINTTPNWFNLDTSAVDVFLPGDHVLFDDSPGVATAISIGSGVAVTPSTLTNSSSVNNFTLFGAGKISGALNLVKLGSSTLTLSTANDFTGAVSIVQGTLKEGLASCLGATATTVVITNTGALDLNGYGLGAQPVIASGSGPAGGGAIVNSGGPAYDNGNALNALTLAADTTFGGPTRWDLGGSSGGMLGTGGKPFNVALAGTSSGIYYEWMNLTVDAALANIYVLPGATLGDKGSTAPGNPAGAVIVSSNAFLTFYNSTGNVTLNKNVVLCDGATMQNGGGANTTLQPVMLATNAAGAPGTCTFKIGGTSLTLSNAITGPGALVKTGNSPLRLAGANTFRGGLTLGSGTVALLSSGTVSSCSPITLAAGTTLDVSGRSDKTLTLAAGQTLQGYGTINGNLTVSPGATAAPGDSATLGTLMATNAIVLLGTTIMKLNKTSATNDVIGGAASLTYGGTLAVSNLSGSLMAGDRFELFNAATYIPSSFASVAPPTPGQGLRWDTSTLAADGTLRIALAPPSLTAISMTPTNLTLQCCDGAPYGTWHVMDSTNLALARTNWTQVAAGSFDATGAFSLTLTNDPSVPQMFYLLQVP